MTGATASDLLLLDSSGWLEYITADTKAAAVAPFLEGARPQLVPTIVLYEVYKKVIQIQGKTAADRFASQALRQTIVALDSDLAFGAAKISLNYRLAMADAIIYATALAHQAELVTSDQAFSGLPGVTLL
ncbi:MAG TPA: type II toxin-antitoxin system VapC family toxin [Candidatus Acidoferrales bacterium]|nr:type II toxin-antitoxin system VapC family toxin [Candidatus Acidoferrales bacterium]